MKKVSGVCILFHGVTADKSTMALIASELARSGLPAVVFDAPRHGYSLGKFPDDCMSFAKAIEQRLNEKFLGSRVRRIYIGHSMGAGTIFSLLRNNDRIQYVVAMGAGNLSPRIPEHVLAIYGLDDKGATESWGGQPSHKDVEIYSPPLTLHADEPWHPCIVNRIVRWSQQRTGLAIDNLSLYRATIKMACLFLNIASGVILTGLALRWGLPRCQRWINKVALGMCVFMLFLILGLPLIQGNFLMILPPMTNILRTSILLLIFPFLALLDWGISRITAIPAIRHSARILEGVVIYTVGLLLITKYFHHQSFFHPLKFTLGYLLIMLVMLMTTLMTGREKGCRSDLVVFHLLTAWIWLAQCVFI